MPIRINLLAEAKAAEELRRHDPVKRVIFGGALAVALTLVWSSSLQLEAMLSKKEVSDRQMEIAARTNDFQHVLTDQKQTAAAKEKLNALKKMINSRFLQGAARLVHGETAQGFDDCAIPEDASRVHH